MQLLICNVAVAYHFKLTYQSEYPDSSDCKSEGDRRSVVLVRWQGQTDDCVPEGHMKSQPAGSGNLCSVWEKLAGPTHFTKVSEN
jgi:hypothetical protein